jgi:hypothetical protein
MASIRDSAMGAALLRREIRNGTGHLAPNQPRVRHGRLPQLAFREVSDGSTGLEASCSKLAALEPRGEVLVGEIGRAVQHTTVVVTGELDDLPGCSCMRPS